MGRRARERARGGRAGGGERSACALRKKKTSTLTLHFLSRLSPSPRAPPSSHSAAVDEYIAYCGREFGIPGLVSVGRGPDGCPAVTLSHPTGFTAVLSLHGATLTSWARPPSAADPGLGEDNEILALRAEGGGGGGGGGGGTGTSASSAGAAVVSRLDGVSPLHGGVTLAFPQVGPAGGAASVSGGGAVPTAPTDGFLRHLHWSIYATGVADGGGGDASPPPCADPAPSVCLVARDTAATRAVWPHAFEAVYTVSLMLVDDWVPPPSPGGVAGGPAAPRTATAAEEASAARAVAVAAAAAAAAAAPPGGEDGGSNGMSPAARAAAKPLGPPHPALALPAGTDPEDAADPEAVAAGLPWAGDPPPPAPPVQLRCVLQVVNPASAPGPLTFTAGVVPHARLPLPSAAAIVGAAGRKALDALARPPGTGPGLATEGGEPVPLGGPGAVDRVWIGDLDRGAPRRPLSRAAGGPPPAPGSIFLETGDWRHALELIPRAGFRDTGARCPGSAGAPALSQGRAGDPYASASRAAASGAAAARAVAAGTAWAAGLVGEVARAVTLPPGGLWTGEAVLRLHDRSVAAPLGVAARAAFAASRPTLALPRPDEDVWQAALADPDVQPDDGGAAGVDPGFVDSEAGGGLDADAW